MNNLKEVVDRKVNALLASGEWTVTVDALKRNTAKLTLEYRVDGDVVYRDSRDVYESDILTLQPPIIEVNYL